MPKWWKASDWDGLSRDEVAEKWRATADGRKWDNELANVRNTSNSTERIERADDLLTRFSAYAVDQITNRDDPLHQYASDIMRELGGYLGREKP
ncbi:MAG: hypothetical protein ACLQU2_01220 [Candidatus Binataceae bacterium]